VDAYEEGWDQHWKVVNDEFEVFLKGDPNFSKFLGRMFMCGTKIIVFRRGCHISLGYTLMM